MKILLFIIATFIFVSCKREVTAKQTCYKGRFVAEGCWSVIQVMEPLNDLPTSGYGEYEHTFGTVGLPEQYKNGEPFYFHVNSVDSNKIYMTYCLPTKYVAEISNISDHPCDEIEK